MRLMEVGTKYLQQGEKKEAENLFEKAYELYSLFWGLKLKPLNIADVKKIDDNQLNAHDEKKTGFMGKLKEIVQKIVDCCVE